MAFLHNTSFFVWFCFFFFFSDSSRTRVHQFKASWGLCPPLFSLLYRVRSLVNRKWIPPIKYSLLLIVSLQKGQCWVSLVTEYSPEHHSDSRVSIGSMFRSDPVSPLMVSGSLYLDLKSFQPFSPDIFNGTTHTPYRWYLKADWKRSSI